MTRTALSIIATLMLSGLVNAQQRPLPQHSMRWDELAARIVEQLALEPGEKVIAVAHPGIFEEIIPHLRYQIMAADAVDLGVVDILETPYLEHWDETVIRRGFETAIDGYVDLFKDVDAAIMLPGTNPVHPAYKAMQKLLVQRGGPRRTIHFHWTDAYSSSGNTYGLTGVTVLPGHSVPPMQVINRTYQDAVLNTDLKALASQMDRFATALHSAEVRITSPAGTDLRFKVGRRDIIQQNGDASAQRMRAGAPFLEREVEIPAGAVRVAPVEESVQGRLVYPVSAWSGHTVSGAQLTFEAGTITRITADSGEDYLQAELAAAPKEALRFGQFALGFNPLLALPDDNAAWLPYFGYGAGVVRLGIGDNQELGGAVTGGYFRWRDLLIDATVTLDGVVWVQSGKLIQP
jgi:hypothetical protein